MENQEIQKNFNLGAILNITTGRLFTNMADVYDVLDYITGEKNSTQQLTKIAEPAKNYVLSLHPELKGVGDDVEINSFEDAYAFIEEQKKIFGEQLPLTPMPKTDEYSYVEPIEETVEMDSEMTR